MRVIYSNRFLRRLQEWWRSPKGEREFLNHKEMLEEILRELALARKKYPDAEGMTITLPQEAVNHLEDFVKSSLEELKIREFLRSLPTTE